MNELTALELDVIRMLLNGDDHLLAILREQQKVATVSERKMTGVGFYTNFSVPPAAPRVLGHPSFEIGDVAAQLEGVKNGAGFTLFVRNGVLSFLEGYTYDEPWPQHITSYAVRYISGQRDWSSMRNALGST
jgi:hypothetical protein